MPKKKKTKHRTYHFTDPDKEGKVLCRCETCGWSEAVDVSNLSWPEGMKAIFAARDKHEEEANAAGA